eukprot:TRINITY_DN33577_c0_g1_i1.p1 TRINITY_DN33577_c0_g1~~TRINITY_DN33577_c0_g1_i1.p1  ORF type:complete len:198 (-),score=24.43 TRINITY_DN33577_c0_g1_i1:770-1333(-)
MDSDAVVHGKSTDLFGQQAVSYQCKLKISKGPLHYKSKIEEYSCDDVYRMLRCMSSAWVGNDWLVYANVFLRNGIDGKFLKHITREDLEQFGMKNALHQKRLYVEIKSLTEARTVQSFNVVIAVGGVRATSHVQSREEIRNMLEAEFQRSSQLALRDAPMFGSDTSMISDEWIPTAPTSFAPAEPVE